ncbi:MAG: hypothetical protein IK081_11370 [Lachnospiraceae bacterium]|nr:hypothetical protein [Lachnospiraceae bacterium]
MEDNQARLCPKCGTPLMEDNFCMGCGSYVDPDSGAAKGNDSVAGYGESDSFGSFGVSPAADPTGIIGESGGYGAGSGNNAAGSYGAAGYGTTSSYGNAGTYDSTGNYDNAGGYNAAGNYDNAGGYNATGNYDNAGGPNGNPSAPVARGYSDKPSFLVSVLIMAGIACAIFLLIFVTDSLTKLKRQSVKYLSPKEEAGYTEYWQVDYQGDKVLQVQDVLEIDCFGESDADIGVYMGEWEEECGKSFGSYSTITYDVTSSGSTVSIIITYGKLDEKEGMQAMAKAANVTMSKDAKYISVKSLDKSLLKNGWKKR